MAISNSRIVIAGAGSVGCYFGGRLALAGRNVRFLLRPALSQALAEHGMHLADLDDAETQVDSAALDLTDDPAEALGTANIILVTVKSGATAAMGDLIARHAPQDAIVVSLQNGVDNVAVLRERLGPDRTVIPGMVPFNIVHQLTSGKTPSFRRATSGTIVIAAGYEDLRSHLDVPGAPVSAHDNMMGVQWSKLLINLNNGLNALSGIPLKTEFEDRGWRRLLAQQMEEGLAVMKAASIRPARFEGVHPRILAKVLPLPDRLFMLLARSIPSIDPRARSSMWDDLEERRPTEIDHIQGKIVDLAKQYGVPAPLNAKILGLIHKAEAADRGSPKLSPVDINFR
ncbi:2-dehydropantoate 2-reductase [Methyloligella sp. 2.7D]|uniref:2-dehydropantoate 2-reductase n=1 Tax=unclassified Methyloligella TaxID=2625955 RepID=UPI00157C0BAC|nr:2-dehydropantoate 2-reductase [Methyloligella sp. GL2]QKP77031.1 2-dehydropantoate 2-reductase [Methyloligella sp. GL2]